MLVMIGSFKFNNINAYSALGGGERLEHEELQLGGEHKVSLLTAIRKNRLSSQIVVDGTLKIADSVSEGIQDK